MSTIQINAEEAPILSCTLYNHETEIKRQVKFDVLAEQLSKGPEVTLVFNLGKQHTLLTGRRAEDLTPNAICLQISGETREAGKVSIIDSLPAAKELYVKIIAKLHERGKLESELRELGEGQATLDALRQKIVDTQAEALTGGGDPAEIVASLIGVSNEISGHAVAASSQAFNKKVALTRVLKEVEELRQDIIKLCGFYTSANAENVADALNSVTELMTEERSQYQQHLDIKLKVETAGPVSFVLCYKVCQAGWLPNYTIHTSASEPDRVKISYYGLVEQKTTEDWKDVKIALGTGSAPDPNAPPHSRCAKVSHATKPKPGLIGGSIHSLPPHSRPAWYGIDHQTGGAYACFDLGVLSIPANAGHHKILISELTLVGSSHLYCSAEADPNVYRALRLKNDSKTLLLPTDAVSLYRDGTFISETQMPLVAPEADFEVFVGQEEDVKVSLDPLSRSKKDTGGLPTGSTDLESWEYTGSINNLRKDPITLIVAFAYPTSSDGSIKVKLDMSSTKYYKIQCDSDLDASTYDFVKNLDKANPQITIVNELTERALIVAYLESGEKRNIHISFIVEKPAGKEISPASSSN